MNILTIHYPLSGASIKAIPLQLRGKDVMKDSVKDFKYFIKLMFIAVHLLPHHEDIIIGSRIRVLR